MAPERRLYWMELLVHWKLFYKRGRGKCKNIAKEDVHVVVHTIGDICGGGCVAFQTREWRET